MTPSQQPPPKLFLIHAGSFVQAAEYARRNNLPPNKWTYLDGPEKMMGLQGSDVVVVKTGTYWDHRFAREIDNDIRLRYLGAKHT
jgi:hypothetical protein